MTSIDRVFEGSLIALDRYMPPAAPLLIHLCRYYTRRVLLGVPADDTTVFCLWVAQGLRIQSDASRVLHAKLVMCCMCKRWLTFDANCSRSQATFVRFVCISSSYSMKIVTLHNGAFQSVIEMFI